MSCPDPAVLDAAAAGGLQPDAQQQLDQHLDSCPECCQIIAELAMVYGSELTSQATVRSLASRGPMAPSPNASPREGSSLGRYRLRRRLGSGGMGVVFEAYDSELQRLVALKLLHAGTGEGSIGVRQRLVREARAMAQLAHPNVVAVHEVGGSGDNVFIAMELVEGTTLGRWLHTKPSADTITEVFLAAGRGLQAAHAVGLVHRDFKPDNILIGSDGRPRVTDFGLSRPEQGWQAFADDAPQLDHSIEASLSATRAGMLIGTPAYMAPEQLRGEAADARADQFGFCITLYEAHFGKRPFPGTSLHELSANVLEGRMVTPPPSAARGLRALLTRGLAVQPEQRYASMSELLIALAATRHRPGLRRPSIVASAGAGMLGAVALAFVLGRSATPASTDPATARDEVAAPKRSTIGNTAEPTAVAESNAPPPLMPTPQRCQPERTLADRWGKQRRKQVLDSLGHSFVSILDADDQNERTVARIDQWANDWLSARTKACADPANNLSRPPALDCLDWQLDRFDALVGEVAQSTSDSSQRVLEAIENMPQPERCTLEPHEVMTISPPASTLDAGRVRLVRRGIEAAWAQSQLALLSASETAMSALVAARKLNFAPLLAEAHLVLGQAFVRDGKFHRAAESLENAAAAAEGCGHQRVLSHAALLLVEVLGGELMQDEGSRRWIRIVANHTQRYDDTELKAALERARAHMLLSRSEFIDARTALAKAAELEDEFHVVPHVHELEVAVLQMGPELALGEPEVLSTLVGRLRALSDDLLMPTNDYRRTFVRAAVAPALVALGRHAEVVDADQEASPRYLFPRAYNESETSLALDVAVATALWSVGRADEATKRFDDASVPASHPSNALVFAAHARMLSQRGEPERAEQELLTGLRNLEREVGENDPRLIGALRPLAQAYIDSKKLKLAEQVLQRATQLVDASVGYGALGGLVETDLGFAAVAAGDRELALKRLDSAHVSVYSAYGIHPRTTATVLQRADLAWAVGQREYAQRLYGATYSTLLQTLGPRDARTMRAKARRAPEDPPDPEPPSEPEPDFADLVFEKIKQAESQDDPTDSD